MDQKLEFAERLQAAMRAAGLLGAYATPSLATLVATASGTFKYWLAPTTLDSAE